jgi:membrane-bound lytic murein transglycosylase D
VGQRLTIWQKQSGASTTVLASSKSSSHASPAPIAGSKTYVVQPGDTLWDISKKFQGLTIERIKALNKLNNAKIQPGQTLIIGI